jgi:hypothetical protein
MHPETYRPIRYGWPVDVTPEIVDVEAWAVRQWDWIAEGRQVFDVANDRWGSGSPCGVTLHVGTPRVTNDTEGLWKLTVFENPEVVWLFADETVRVARTYSTDIVAEVDGTHYTCGSGR